MYAWLPIDAPSDFATRLQDVVSPEFAPAKVGETLAAGISDAVKGVLVEANYIDKDYRSTYYQFYAKKGQYYNPNCVRLHFFDATVSFNSERLQLTCPDNRLADHYFGFMVLRPTTIATIGRTVLSPGIRSGACGLIITANHKAHVLGEKLTVHGFPSMDQHVDIAVCAHVACWSILRHYSERYSLYREFLTHDITMMAQDFDPGGLLPSRGLHVWDAERVFQAANTFPLHISKADPERPDPQFFRQAGAYIESGFPLFAAMHGRRHAMAVVGHEWREPTARAGTGMRYAWDEMAQLAVVDDNHLPYLSIPVESGGAPYSAADIDAFIVPLPEKIFYPADAVDRLAPTLFHKLGPAVGLPPEDETIIRYFVTTASALRHFVRERESEFDTALLQIVMTLPLAQFVWIVEFARESQWAVRQVAARAVIDATASIHDALPLWLIHSDTKAIVIDRSNPSPIIGDRVRVTTFPRNYMRGYSRMEQNLSPIVRK